ncbi:hypothetical protein, partial [Nocardia farcinica]
MTAHNSGNTEDAVTCRPQALDARAMAVVGGSPESMEVCVGVEVRTEGVTKSFGSQRIWQDVSLTLP